MFLGQLNSNAQYHAGAGHNHRNQYYTDLHMTLQTSQPILSWCTYDALAAWADWEAPNDHEAELTDSISLPGTGSGHVQYLCRHVVMTPLTPFYWLDLLPDTSILHQIIGPSYYHCTVTVDKGMTIALIPKAIHYSRRLYYFQAACKCSLPNATELGFRAIDVMFITHKYKQGW